MSQHAPRPVDDETDPVEVARLYVPRTGDTVHIGYGNDGTEPYVTIGYADNDLVELDMKTALDCLAAYCEAMKGAQGEDRPEDIRQAS